MATTKVKRGKMKAKAKAKKPKSSRFNGNDDHVGFFITNASGKTAELPVAPPAVTMNFETDDSSEHVINLGEVNRIGKRKLRSVEVESFMPWRLKTSRLVNARKLLGGATDYVNFFKDIQKKKKPVQIVVSQTSMTMKCTLKSFEYGFKDGNSEDYYYKLVFTEYRPFGAQKAGQKRKSKVKSSNGRKSTTSGTVKTGKTRAKPTNKINRSSSVTVKGTLWRTPNKPGGSASATNGATGTVAQVRQGQKKPYLIKDDNGNVLGWTDKKSLTNAN